MYYRFTKHRIMPRRRHCARGYRAPVWVAAVMVVAVVLRVLSGLPAVSTPHHHGGIYHTHEAGGIAHDHTRGHAHKAERAPILHRHGDGPYHVHSVEREVARAIPKPRRTVRSNEFPVYIPVRWPPEAYRDTAQDHSHDLPAPLEGDPEGHPGYYFCAAVEAALESAPVAEPSAVAPLQSSNCHVAVLPRRIVAGPRQSRAPPHFLQFQKV